MIDRLRFYWWFMMGVFLILFIFFRWVSSLAFQQPGITPGPIGPGLQSGEAARFHPIQPVLPPWSLMGDSLTLRLVDRTLFCSSLCSFTAEDRLYLGAGTAILIYDISLPAEPSLLGHFYTDGVVWNIYADRDTVYVADGAAGLRIYDCRYPSECEKIGDLGNPTDGYAYGVWVTGGYAYIADGAAGLVVAHLGDPGDPQLIAQYNPLPWNLGATDIRVLGGIAYMTAADFTLILYGRLAIIDVSHPSDPDAITVYNTEGVARALHVEPDTTVFIANGYRMFPPGRSNLLVLDCSDPENPDEIGGYLDSTHYALDVAIEGETIYLANGYIGVEGSNFLLFDRTDIGPDMTPVGTYTTQDIAWGVSARGGIAYISDEWGGLDVVDCRDPGDLHSLMTFDLGGYPQDVAVRGDVVYVAAEGGNIRVVDASDPSNLEEVAIIGTQSWASAVVARGETLFVAEGWDVPAQGNSGLEAILATDPLNPIVLDFLDYGVSGHCYDLFPQENLIYVAKGIDGFLIVDASDPSNLVELGRYDAPDRAFYDVFVQDSVAYVAAADLGGSGFFNPDTNSLILVNVRDPENPSPMGSCVIPDVGRGVWVGDTLAYVAAEKSGLRVINCSDPWSPREIGYLDTGGSSKKVQVINKLAYLTDGSGGIRVIDVSDPTAPVESAQYPTTGDAYGLVIDGDDIYVADRYAGLFLFRLDSSVGVDRGGAGLPRTGRNLLLQNWPNPFNPSTTIAFEVRDGGSVDLSIYSLRGRRVRTLAAREVDAGRYQVVWDGRDDRGMTLPSGIYFYRLDVRSSHTSFSSTRKLIVAR